MKLKLTKGKMAIIAMMIMVIALTFIWSSATDGQDRTLGDQHIAQEATPNVAEENEGELPLKPVETNVAKEAEASSDEPILESEISSVGNQASEVKSTASTPSDDGVQEQMQVGKDPYQTGPVPEGKPLPVEPEAVITSEKAMTCSLTVRCESILDNKDKLDQEKIELVPSDGMIFTAQDVTFYEGESVFNVMQRELKKAKIHLEFVNTPVYNSAYIEGIHNLYEFDCGELSGWMYKVNDWFPNYGCSRYLLQEGDDVQWVYTCDLGRDIGGDQAIGGTSDE